jgi:hypothetical protein
MLCGVASASQPPPSREDLIRDANERAVVSRVRACPSAAGRRSYFGAAEVVIRYRKQSPPLAVIRRSHGIPADQARCVAKVLRTLSLVGDLGACLAFDGDMRTTRAVLAERRQELEAKLRALDHGKRRSFERVTLRARAERPLQLWTKAVATPLARGDSQIEARCDTTRALECLRAEHEYKPVTFDGAALDRCIAAARSSREDLAVSFDISGAGRVKALEAYSLSVKAKRDSYDERPTLAPTLARCIGAVFARARYASTSGGDCYASMGLDTFP